MKAIQRVIARKRVAGGGADGSVGSIVHTSTLNVAASNTTYLSPSTAVGGDVRYGKIYCSGGTQRTVCVSLKDSSGTVLGTGSGTSPVSAGWLIIDCGTFSIDNGVEYHTAISASAVLTIGAVTGGTTNGEAGKACSESTAIPAEIDSKTIAIIFENFGGDPV